MNPTSRLKEHFESALSKPVELESYAGNEWWQISDAQAEVFGLELADMPALVIGWMLYESVADVASHDFNGSPLCIDVRRELPFVDQGVVDPGQWITFAALIGIREKKAFAWFYKTTFEIERSWAAPLRSNDQVPMPRATLIPMPTHPPAFDRCPNPDDLIPF